MSNLGFQWVYRLLNREEDVTCERFFYDEAELGGRGPRTLEGEQPLASFPLVAFSISWEMDYVHFLRMLPASRIPLRREERRDGDPVLLVGGDCARINPLPLTPYVDVFAMGDAERLVPGIAATLRADLPRREALERLAGLKGFYVPAVHGERAESAEDGRIVVDQLRAADGPGREPPHTSLLTPHTELSDKLLIEVARGCSEMCRFCWAAYARAPQVRVSAASILAVAERCRPLTSRVGLIATAVADHPEILPILRGLSGMGFHIALSSIKIDAISEELLEVLARQGEKSLAIAPEAGNERLRRATGWEVVAVPGLLPEHVFFAHLAHRRFPVTVWLREEHEFDYIVEPDVFHDFFGHVPLLFDPVFADYMQAYGRGGQKAEGLHALEYLARLYWYTVEFGLIRTDGGLRIYGAGILSSPSEVTYALSSPLPHRIGFDLKRVMRTRYKIDTFQQTYFVIEDFGQLFRETAPDFTPLYAEIAGQEPYPADTVLPQDPLYAPVED